ncbi:hypothetical protein HDU97_001519 [Phlyctochytrium planicorne]|nr:hypothetical protein HDU97_001519 [Phlyctochytrium planicorne]
MSEKAFAALEALEALETLCSRTESLWALILVERTLKETRASRNEKIAKAEALLEAASNSFRLRLQELHQPPHTIPSADSIQASAPNTIDELQTSIESMTEIAHQKTKKLQELVSLCQKMEYMIRELTEPDPWEFTERRSFVHVNASKSNEPRSQKSLVNTPAGTPRPLE